MKKAKKYSCFQSGPSSSMGSLGCDKSRVIKAFNKWIRSPFPHNQFRVTILDGPNIITESFTPITEGKIVKTTTGSLIC